MTKISFNNSVSVRTVLPSLNETVDGLNTAISIANSLDIPDFSEADYLRNLSSNLTNVRNNLNHAKTWLYESNKNYDAATDDLKNLLVKISKVNIEKNNVMIK